MPAAPSNSALFSRLRSSFSLTPTLGMPSATSKSAFISPKSSSPSIDHLTVLEEAIAEAEAQAATQLQPPALQVPSPQPLDVVAQAVPSVIAQQTDTLNAQYGKPVAKEAWQNSVLPTEVPLVAEVPPVPESVPPPEVANLVAETPTASEQGSQDQLEAGQHVQYYEVGPPAPEIPVEVEGYLQEVKEHQEQLPHEIVMVADPNAFTQAPPQSLRPVVVLPITPELETVGIKKNPSWSVRWLVEWSRKLMRMFAGKIIYRETSSV